MKYFKVWIEIEEYDDETDDGVSRDDLSFGLPFADSGMSETEEGALEIAQRMHAAVNPGFEAQPITIAKE